VVVLQFGEAEPMKVARTIMIAGAAVFALATQASAYTLSGTIPPHAPPKSVVLHPHLPLPQLVRLTMSAPPVNAGVSYALTYCIGPVANPCGLPGEWTVEVSAGQTVVRTVPASAFTNKVFVVGQGTKKAVPYKVQIDPGL
jgi:hypothetical protein